MVLSSESSVTSNIDGDVELAKQLLSQGKPVDAIAKLSDVLKELPEHQEALYILAVCYRYASNLDSSLAALDRLLALYPGYARGYQERGHSYRKLNRSAEAIRAYERAVEFNPALLASWQNLSALHNKLGNAHQSVAAAAQAQALSKLPLELLSVSSMIHEGKLYLAEKLCRSFVQKNPQHVEGMRLLAKIGVELGILDDAEFLLESALAFTPDFLLARYDYSQVLFKRQRYEESLKQAELVLEKRPNDPAFRLAYANAAAATGGFEKALKFYDELIGEHQDHHHYHMLKGHAQKTLGDLSGAVASYHNAAQIKPDHGDAYWSLANLKSYRFDEVEIDRMKEAESRPDTDLLDRYQLCFALGKALEDRREFGGAFEYYQRGNRLKTAELGYQAEKTDREFVRQKEVCTAAFFRERAEWAVDSSEPVFIVGLPRAGSTLLEQILASHPMVDGTIELPNIISLAQKLGGRHMVDEESRYPTVLQELTEQQVERFGREYIDSTRVYRKGAPFFTDKMPNNFCHIGLIQLILPNARIIDARRHPMACCFSNFKQLFGQGQDFTYGLKEIGQYYRGYVDLMDHWERLLPEKILRIQYEDVVGDLETQVRRLLDFLGLPFDQRCIEFHKNERAVHTPSAEQVRQPVYTSGIEQWKNFEKYLDTLKESLSDA